MKKPLLNAVFLILAFMFLALGAVGVLIPLLPTTPFLLLAAYFFAKGSARFNRWFLNTTLYQKHLDEFIRTRSMTRKKKLYIVIPVSLMLLGTAWLAPKPAAKALILCIILIIYYYFTFQIRTAKDL